MAIKESIVSLRVGDKFYDLTDKSYLAVEGKADVLRYEAIRDIIRISDWDADKKARAILSVFPLLGRRW
jgi:hypothetical protein